MKKILLFEDNQYIKSAYGDTFIRAGFDVQIQNNGENCLEVVKNYSPDIVLLDLMMPGFDGFSVLEKFAQKKIAKKIPVLVLTNLSELDFRNETMRLGATEYYEKVNVTAKELLEIVEKYLS